MKTIVSFLLLICILTTVGCASSPTEEQYLELTENLEGFNFNTQKTYILPKSNNTITHIQAVKTPRKQTRFFMVSGTNENLSLTNHHWNIYNLDLMRSYSQKRNAPFYLLYAVEKNFERYLDENFSKKLANTAQNIIGVKSDDFLPSPFRSLDQGLQFDSKDDTYLFIEKWMYKERRSSSLLSITDAERESFLDLLLTKYFSMSQPIIKKIYPRSLLFSPPVREEDLSLKTIITNITKYNDVIVIKYPDHRMRHKELSEICALFSKPIYFVDVPQDAAVETVAPLLMEPKIIGWEWGRLIDEPQKVSHFQKQLNQILPKLVSYFDETSATLDF